MTVGFRFPPDDPGLFPSGEGGLRISIDGGVLTDHLDRDHGGVGYYDATGTKLDLPKVEFTGDHWTGAIRFLQEAVVRFGRGEFGRYEEVPAEIRGYDPDVVVLSFADGDRARIAFQPAYATDDTSNYSDDSLRGYLVDVDELCRELISCYHEGWRYVENAFGDQSDQFGEDLEEFGDWLDEQREELEALLEE